MPKRRGDGNLYITFNSVGQGDCIIASLPNGKTLMVDCGTSRWDTDYNTGIDRGQTKDEQKQQVMLLRQGVIDLIYGPRYLSGYNTIDALVLTHPDKDHCNELSSILKANVTIKSVYHSTTLDKYIQGGAHAWLLNKVNLANQYAITINQNAQQINGANIPDAGPKSNTDPTVVTINRKSTAAATKGFVKILEGTKGGGKTCGVYIIASNVLKYQDVNDGDTKVINRASVVTLIIFGSQTFLLCGDATANTEKFILDTYNADRDRIADIEVVQVGHHGSRTSSSDSTDDDQYVSAIDWVGTVNPSAAIISAATDSGSRYKLPRYETISKYVGGARMVDNDHYITCWWKNPAVYQQNGKKRKPLTPASSEKGQKRVLTDIVSTGDEGPIDIEKEDADV